MNTYHRMGRRAGEPPLSPFLTIFRWPVTMATSIGHRVTGVGMTAGVILLAAWLFAIENGPKEYDTFYALITTVPGQIILWALVWCYVYHFLNGIRHLIWDLGYGFELSTANKTGILVGVLSVLITVALFLFVLTGHGGYYAAI